MRCNTLIASLAVTASIATPLSCAKSQTAAQTTAQTAANPAERLIRLDSRTGAMSSCSKTDAAWVCTSQPDERSAQGDEIGRLEGENARLKSELARRQTTGTVPAGKPAEAEARNQAQNEAKNEANSEIKSAPSSATRSDLAAPSRTVAVEPPVTADGPRVAPTATGNDAKIELQPSTQESVRKDGFLSRAWQQLIDLVRMFSPG